MLLPWNVYSITRSKPRSEHKDKQEQRKHYPPARKQAKQQRRRLIRADPMPF